VLFGFGKSSLSDEAKARLDELAKDAMSRKRFVIEVEGFTDSTGSPAVNFELSQKRAEAVVRYLTSTHKIPLRTIHLIGSGSESPVGENKTVQGRRQNRRVEVRLFAPEVENSSALTSAQLR
jgi:outer membrane protein OmpA-like peptidoglycan-associated protein